MWNLFEKVKENHTIAEMARVLNVAPGTVSRWNTLKNVPEAYRFDLMKMAGEPIDYTIYSPKDKDQFFTPDTVAKHCVDVVTQTLEDLGINIEDYTFVEPSAGSGRFLPHIPSNDYIAMDIEPMAENIIQQDFFDWVPYKNKKYIVIGVQLFNRI